MGSIKQFYPTANILVADDSERPSKYADIHLPFDSGLARGRNILLRETKTKYFVLLDDDFLFTEKTKIETFLKYIENYDIVGGRVIGCNYTGELLLENGVLKYIKSDKIDIIPNFFMGKTKKIRAIGWDDRQKLAEHTDFFLNAKGKIKIKYLPEVEVKNMGGGNGKYRDYRARGEEYAYKFMNKWGIKKIIRFDGTVYENCSFNTSL